MRKADYYEILGIPRTASEGEIKKAYRQAALKFHPDRNPGNPQAEESFKLASEAYQVLADPPRRQIYDQFGHEGLKGRGFQPFTGFEDIFSAFGDIFGDLGDLFGMGRSARRQARQGSHLRVDLELTLEEAASGCDKEVTVSGFAICDRCHGAGSEPGTRPVACATCGGAGQVTVSQGFFTLRSTCPACGGAGAIIRDPCTSCRGRGRVQRHRSLVVKVPAGVDTGSKLRLAGEGEAGGPGAAPGDLFVVVHVARHPIFEREGDDLLCQVPISITQAALGGDLEVPTLEGPEKLSIRPGTQFGDTRRLRGRGMPSLRGYVRGDLVVQFQVKVPTRLTAHQEELLRAFAETEGLNSPDGADRKNLFQRIKESIEQTLEGS